MAAASLFAVSDDDAPRPSDLAAALLAWAPACPSLEALRHRIAERRTALQALQRDDAPLTLATAHGTKGLGSTMSSS